MSIIRNRELSQFGSFIYIDNTSQKIGIATEATPFVGIGTPDPITKLHVVGDTNLDGNLTITDGTIEASSYTLNGNPLVDLTILQWSYASNGTDMYRLQGNVGIGTSVFTERLTVNGNVSAGQFISTITSGTAPLVVSSTSQVFNLNASLLAGKTPPVGDIVGTTDTQTLTNKTLTSPTISSILNGGTLTVPTGDGTLIRTGSVGLVTSGMISDLSLVNVDIATNAGIVYSKLNLSNSILAADIAVGAGITYGKLSLSNSITNADIATNAGISITKLSTNTISGITLGSNLATLTFGTYLTGTSYNGSTAITIGINASTSGSSNIVARDGSGNFSAGTINVNNITATNGNFAGIVTASSVVIGSAITINSSGINATSGIITASSIRDISGNVRAIPQNSQSDTYTLAITDVGKHVNITAGVGVTVPSNIFSSGDAITIFNNTGTAKTVFVGSGVTMRLAGTGLTGTRYLSQYALSTIICISSNVFAISGAGVT
jgi:hypothetical protein